MILIDDTPDYAQNTLNYPKNRPCKNMEKINFPLNGKLIVFEGIDGSGKSTQCQLIQRYLSTQGIKVQVHSFKESDILHHAILKGKWENFDPYTHILLYLASITDVLARCIIPALEDGYVVLMDRYTPTLYVRGRIRGVPEVFLHSMDCLRKPDYLFYIDIDEQTALERKLSKEGHLPSYWEAGGDLELSNNLIENWLLYQNKLRLEYNKIIELYPQILRLNGEMDESEVFKYVNNVLSL